MAEEMFRQPDELDPTDCAEVAGFDLEGWLADVRVPTRARTVYGRADLLGDIDEVERELRMLPNGEQGVADTTKAELKRRWEDLAEKVAKSALTFRLKSIVEGDRAAARKAHDETPIEGKPGMDPKDAALRSEGLHLLHRLIESPKLTIEQLVAIEAKIGEGQVAHLVDGYMEATRGVKKPTVPFSLRSSQDRPGGTS